MHRTTPSHGGGLFKGGNIFGGSKTPTTSTRRPSTSGGSPTGHSEHTTSGTFSRKSSNAKSSKSSYRGHSNSTTIGSLSPEKRRPSTQHTDNHPLPVAANRQDFESQPKSADSFGQVVSSAEAVHSPASRTDSYSSTTPYSNMLARPATGYPIVGPNGPPAFAPMQPPSPTLENITYQHIQETSSKRISTLDYLRKA